MERSALQGLAAFRWAPGWMATVLLVSRHQLERADISPGEAGRRVVDVMAERFG